MSRQGRPDGVLVVLGPAVTPLGDQVLVQVEDALAGELEVVGSELVEVLVLQELFIARGNVDQQLVKVFDIIDSSARKQTATASPL